MRGVFAVRSADPGESSVGFVDLSLEIWEQRPGQELLAAVSHAPAIRAEHHWERFLGRRPHYAVDDGHISGLCPVPDAGDAGEARAVGAELQITDPGVLWARLAVDDHALHPVEIPPRQEAVPLGACHPGSSVAAT